MENPTFIRPQVHDDGQVESAVFTPEGSVFYNLDALVEQFSLTLMMREVIGADSQESIDSAKSVLLAILRSADDLRAEAGFERRLPQR